ncbi:MAG TPA: hypothetical protein DE312_07150 [Gallionella sp.]|nr:MAG: hypothetical protein A2Z87_13395 [Gallionellales bacterium GWA2_54_124]OGT17279.1 MAG: hypothetical protein A2522_06925 [Gallionellales bacterium RIFOXYD12_FULL_53_10]HCI53075.1 hypothetical protein [Gallionella sp.]
MGKLIDQVRELTFGWVRKGGKIGRREQVRIMLDFAGDVETLGPTSLGQVGARQVIQYWKANRHLSDATLMSRWYSIRHLWTLAGKSGEPPKPRLSQDVTANKQTP